MLNIIYYYQLRVNAETLGQMDGLRFTRSLTQGKELNPQELQCYCLLNCVTTAALCVCVYIWYNIWLIGVPSLVANVNVIMIIIIIIKSESSIEIGGLAHVSPISGDIALTISAHRLQGLLPVLEALQQFLLHTDLLPLSTKTHSQEGHRGRFPLPTAC